MATRTRRKADAPVEEVEELEELDDELEELDTPDDEGEATDAEESDTSDFLSAKEAAQKLGVDARVFRKFLRSQRGKVGQGNRWAIDPDEFEELKKSFEDFHKPKTKVTIAPDADEAEELDDEIEDLDD